MTDGFLIGGHNLGTEKGSGIKELSSRTNPSPYDPQGKLVNNDGNSSKSKKRPTLDAQSFIFNEDMKRIRKAESVILHAEARFGVLSRDPEGRLVPILQVNSVAN